MYDIKQIKICAEYQDVLPRPRLDLSSAPGPRPLGHSPISWLSALAHFPLTYVYDKSTRHDDIYPVLYYTEHVMEISITIYEHYDLSFMIAFEM